MPLHFSHACLSLGHQNNIINFQLLKEAKSPCHVAYQILPPSSWHTFLSLPHTIPPLRHYYFSYSFCQMPLSLFGEHSFYPLPHPGLNLIFLRRFNLDSPPLHNFSVLFSPHLSTFPLKCTYFSSVQSSRVRLFVNPRTAARQASLSITNSRNLFKLMSIESVMLSNHFIVCRPLLLSPALTLSQHQGLFQGVSSSHQVAKVLEFQLQHRV